MSTIFDYGTSHKNPFPKTVMVDGEPYGEIWIKPIDDKTPYNDKWGSIKVSIKYNGGTTETNIGEESGIAISGTRQIIVYVGEKKEDNNTPYRELRVFTYKDYENFKRLFDGDKIIEGKKQKVFFVGGLNWPKDILTTPEKVLEYMENKNNKEYYTEVPDENIIYKGFLDIEKRIRSQEATGA